MIKRFFCFLFIIISILSFPFITANAESTDDYITLYFDNFRTSFTNLTLYSGKSYNLIQSVDNPNIYYVKLPATCTSGHFDGNIGNQRFVINTSFTGKNGYIFSPSNLNYSTSTGSGIWCSSINYIYSSNSISDNYNDVIQSNGLIYVILNCLGIDCSSISDSNFISTVIFISCLFVLFLVIFFVKSLISLTRSGRY